MMGITYKRRMFAKAFAANFDRREAVRAAGYELNSWARTATRLLADPEVQKMVETYQSKNLQKFDATQITDEYVLGSIADLLERIKECGMGSWQAQAETRLLEMLGKYRQLFSERVEVGLDQKFVAVLEEGRQRARQRALTAGVIAALPAACEVVADSPQREESETNDNERDKTEVAG